MSAPLDALHANRHFARRRRVELLRSGGLAPGVADHVFRTPGTGLAPSPAITAAQVLAPATFVAKTISQTGQGDTVFIGTASTLGLGFQVSDEISLILPGFGLVAADRNPLQYSTGALTLVLGIDPPNTRAVLQINGITIFDGTDPGLLNWGPTGETYDFGVGTGSEQAIYKSLEIYLNRLPAVMG